jgi:hypothetical protein
MSSALLVGMCPECGAVHFKKICSLYSGEAAALAMSASINTSGMNLMAVAASSHPPSKMPNWTGWTLSLLLWPPLLVNLLIASFQHFARGMSLNAALSGQGLPLIGLSTALAAWIIPAMLQRKKSNDYNSQIWAPAMELWHTQSVCLDCGKVF